MKIFRSSTDYELLTYERFDSSNNPLHAMRFHWFPKGDGGYYMCDYVQLVLVLDGEAEIDDAGGNLVSLRTGSLYFTPPYWPYRIAVHPVTGLLEIRIVMRHVWVETICRRFTDELPTLPWEAGPVDSTITLSAAEVAWLRSWTDDLMAPSCDLLTQEAFLLDVLQRLRRRQVLAHDAEDLPAWLRAALVEMTASQNLAGGPARLAQLAGKSMHQVNLLCRRHLDGTATEVVNRLRLEYAARALRLTDNTVEDIAGQCGLSNCSYFTRLFTAAYGVSPGRYRRNEGG